MNVTALGTDALTAPVIASLISPAIYPVVDSTVDPTIEVAAAVRAAVAAAGPCAAASPQERACWLESIADAVTYRVLPPVASTTRAFAGGSLSRLAPRPR